MNTQRHYNNPEEKLRNTAKLEGGYMQKLLKESKNGRQVSIHDILRAKTMDGQKNNIKPKVGDMVVFQYESIDDSDLPYWDRFPLIFLIDVKDNHFTGINLHYLPPLWRLKLLANLKNLNNNNNYDENTRLRISYQILKRSVLLRAFKPCFKEYALRGLRSKFIKIHSSEWDIASVLPVAKFKKARPKKVWSDSLKSLRSKRKETGDDTNSLGA